MRIFEPPRPNMDDAPMLSLRPRYNPKTLPSKNDIIDTLQPIKGCSKDMSFLKLRHSRI